MIPFSALKKNTDSFIAAIGGFVIILLFTHHSGIGISPDSVVYSSAAENLRTNGTLKDFTGNPVVNFPAFYPFFLSAVTWITGLKPLLFAPYLNAFLFAAIIFFAGYTMEKFEFKSKWYKIAVLSCIVISPALLEDYSMLWSETLFIVLLFFFIITMYKYFQFHSIKFLTIAAVIASIAMVTRYAGIAIIITGAVLLLINKNLSWRLRVKDILLFSLISPLLLIINLLRNYHVSGTTTGFREKSITSITENLQNTGTAFCDWLPFFHGHYTLAVGITIIILAGLAFICGKQFFINGCIKNYTGIAAAFSLLYILFMIITACLTNFESLNSRLMSPVFIPLLWSGSSWIVSLSRKNKWTIGLGLILFLCFQYNQFTIDRDKWNEVKEAGIPGYTEDQWKSSEIIQFIQKDSLPFQKNYTLYSNTADAVYFFTGRETNFLPHKMIMSKVNDLLNDPHCYVIWFTDDDPDIVDLSFITGEKKMILIKEFNDGAIYGNGK